MRDVSKPFILRGAGISAFSCQYQRDSTFLHRMTVIWQSCVTSCIYIMFNSVHLIVLPRKYSSSIGIQYKVSSGIGTEMKCVGHFKIMKLMRSLFECAASTQTMKTRRKCLVKWNYNYADEDALYWKRSLRNNETLEAFLEIVNFIIMNICKYIERSGNCLRNWL